MHIVLLHDESPGHPEGSLSVNSAPSHQKAFRYRSHWTSAIPRTRRRRIVRKMAELAPHEQQELLTRIHEKIVQLPNGCWHWKGTIHNRRGAVITFADAQHPVVKRLWEAEHGTPTGPLFSTCRDACCVRPDHRSYTRPIAALEERWKRLLSPLRPKGCLLFMGKSVGNDGYKAFYHEKKWHYAHVFAYWLALGEWPPKGLQVQHLCNHRDCVEESHLVLGTPKENSEYMVACGRAGRVSKIGERHANSHLTDVDVLNIRRLHANGMQRKVIAAEFGITPAYVNKIVSHTAWKHVGITYKQCVLWQAERACLCRACPYGEHTRQPRPASRLLENTQLPRNTDECYGWNGDIDAEGQATFEFDNHTFSAATVAYKAYFGEIPTGYSVWQTCGHGTCARPEHLELIPIRPEDNLGPIRKHYLFSEKEFGISLLEIEAIKVSIAKGIPIAQIANSYNKTEKAIEFIRDWQPAKFIDPTYKQCERWLYSGPCNCEACTPDRRALDAYRTVVTFV